MKCLIVLVLITSYVVSLDIVRKKVTRRDNQMLMAADGTMYQSTDNRRVMKLSNGENIECFT